MKRGEQIVELAKNEQLQFKDISQEEKTKRGILGVLYGKVADISIPTRNGRKYSEKLWDKVFSNEIVKEMLNAGGIPGELDHPADRQVTLPDRIAIMLPEAPKKDNKGHLVARFDILDTPCGRIAYALAKYGFKLGISSRGSGDTEIDMDGNEEVVPDTYEFEAFDLVLLPANKCARLDLMTESANSTTAKLKRELKEAYLKSSKEEQAVMDEVLEGLDIGYKSKDFNINGRAKKNTADSNGVGLLKQYQKVLFEKQELERRNAQLQEQLSVSNAKDRTAPRVILGNPKQTAEQEITTRALKARAAQLQERLEKAESVIAQQSEAISKLQDDSKKVVSARASLTESVAEKDRRIADLSSQIQMLNEAVKQAKTNIAELEQEREQKDKEAITLQEKIQQVRADAKKAVETAKAETDRYKTLAQKSMRRYVESKATAYGVKPEDILEKLPKKCTFDDVDNACESVRAYTIAKATLPFGVLKESVNSKKSSVTVNSKRETVLTDESSEVADDDISTLIQLFPKQ